MQHSHTYNIYMNYNTVVFIKQFFVRYENFLSVNTLLFSPTFCFDEDISKVYQQYGLVISSVMHTGLIY